MIQVVCGVIYQGDKIFIARRNQSKYLGGHWEFPGGKINKRESEKMALKRELMEEFGMEVNITERIGDVVHSYPNLTIKLIAYRCEFVSASFQLVDHDMYSWVEAGDLSSYQLSEADKLLVKSLF